MMQARRRLSPPFAAEVIVPAANRAAGAQLALKALAVPRSEWRPGSKNTRQLLATEAWEPLPANGGEQ